MPPGRDCGNKRAYLPGGLLPDFRPSGPVVRETVGGVIEISSPRTSPFLRQAPGNVVVVVWMGVRLLRHDEDLRAQRAQKVDLFSRLGFWNDDQRTVARAWPMTVRPMPVFPPVPSTMVPPVSAVPRLGILDNTQRDAILHRSAGVHEFGLAQDFAAGQLRKAAQADERGLADLAIHAMIS